MRTIVTVVIMGAIGTAVVLLIAATLVSAGECKDRGGAYLPTFLGLYGCVGQRR